MNTQYNPFGSSSNQTPKWIGKPTDDPLAHQKLTNLGMVVKMHLNLILL